MDALQRFQHESLKESNSNATYFDTFVQAVLYRLTRRIKGATLSIIKSSTLGIAVRGNTNIFLIFLLVNNYSPESDKNELIVEFHTEGTCRQAFSVGLKERVTIEDFIDELENKIIRYR